MSFSLAADRPHAHNSLESLFSKLSEPSQAESPITEPGTDVLVRASRSKGEDTDALPDIFFGPTSEYARESKRPYRTAVVPR